MIVTRLLRIARRIRRRDEGVALPAVIGIGLVITLLVTAGAAIATSGAVKSATDRDSLNAMQAAYAGIADYQSRLTNNNEYWKYGAATSFTTGSTFTGTDSNGAFGTTAGGTWATVSGSSNTESYRYEVNNSTFSSTGSVQVRVTGRAGQQTRSLVATVRGTGFIDYLYFTDFESSDPDLTGEVQDDDHSQSCLSVHMDDPAYDSGTACSPVQFISGDVLSGPIRSNDEFTICGATFNQEVQSTAADNVYNRPNNCSAANFQQKSPTHAQPAHTGSLVLPQTNTDMPQAARSDINTSPGCLYTGPTSITFNADGSMQIVSPWSKATQTFLKADGSYGGTMGTACGTQTALRSTTGAKVTLSANLVYVQNVPVDSKDPNYYATGTFPSTSPASGAILCSKTTGSGSNKVTTYGNGLKSPLGDNYPSPGEYTGSAGPTSTDYPYYCRNGDAFVSGTFHGAMTIGAQSHIYIVGSIGYQDSTKDILGLVGQTAVEIWNPVSCSDYNRDGTCSTDKGDSTLMKYSGGSNVTINAAMASNDGTFMVENYAYGARLGTLTVNGSIAQKWRGAVGVSYGDHITGFTKAYGYDQRLKNTAPPKFLQPVTTTYSVSQQVEVSAAFKSTGAAN